MHYCVLSFEHVFLAFFLLAQVCTISYLFLHWRLMIGVMLVFCAGDPAKSLSNMAEKMARSCLLWWIRRRFCDPACKRPLPPAIINHPLSPVPFFFLAVSSASKSSNF